GRRGAPGEAAGGLPNGAPIFDDPHDPLPEVMGQGGRHDQLHHARPRHPGIRSSDSVQDRTALAIPDNERKAAEDDDPGPDPGAEADQPEADEAEDVNDIAQVRTFSTT